jgi:hypothetical protein
MTDGMSIIMGGHESPNPTSPTSTTQCNFYLVSGDGGKTVSCSANSVPMSVKNHGKGAYCSLHHT